MGSKNKYKRKMRHESDEEDSEGFEDDVEDSEGEDEPGPSGRNGQPAREAIYNTDALHEKLEDIAWADEVEWTEVQTITAAEKTQVENVDDDLQRELAFYNQALSAAQQAIQRFDAASIPWLRPQDYYAEMVKTDQHMAKVKEQLMFEQRGIEQAEERRKQREQKLYGKQVQQAREREKQADKKRQIDSISKLRKQREKSGFQGDLDMDAELDAMNKRQFNANKLGHRGSGAQQPGNKKRLARDQKYGFGGRKGLKKQNDAYSAAATDGYKRMGAKGGVQKKGGKGGKAQRPGKARRAQGRK